MSDIYDSAKDCRLLFNNATQSEGSLILLRSKLQAIARRLGLPELKTENMLIVASELVSNNVKHAGGRGMVQLWQQPGHILDLVSLDYGPGIADLAVAETDGYSSVSTLGKGLGAIRRLSDESYIYTQPLHPNEPRKWSGTVVLARFYLDDGHKLLKSGFRFGWFVRSLSDHRYNGDRIYLQHSGKVLRWLHLDGLGHGEEAERATTGLADHLAYHDTPQTLLQEVDKQLADTRGAVAVISEIDLAKRRVQLTGVGDMHAHLYCEGEMQHLVFPPGILGREHRSMNLHQFEFGQRSLVLSASDGIRRNWDRNNFVGLFNHHPQLIAYTLGNIMGRISDDQSLCIASIN